MADGWIRNLDEVIGEHVDFWKEHAVALREGQKIYGHKNLGLERTVGFPVEGGNGWGDNFSHLFFYVYIFRRAFVADK
jgi:hypothetical protein